MGGKIDEMRAAGFSDQDIGGYATEKRQEMIGAGFQPNEVDGYLNGVTPPATPPQSFLDRLSTATTSDIEGQAGLNQILSTTAAAAKSGFESSISAGGSFGLTPDDEAKLTKLGIFRDPETGRGGPLRFMNEAILRPTAAAADALMRAPGALIAGAVGGVGEAAKQLGQSETENSRMQRELNLFGNFALQTAGTDVPTDLAFSRPHIDDLGKVHDQPIGGLPKAEDFSNTAKAIGAPANEAAEQKLLTLYEDHGFHPAEVAHDANRDVTVTQHLLSDGSDLPYGIDEAKQAHEPILDAALTEAKIDPRNVSGDVRDRTLSIMQNDEKINPLDAYQRAVVELTDEERQRAGKEPVLPVAVTGPAPEAGGRSFARTEQPSLPQPAAGRTVRGAGTEVEPANEYPGASDGGGGSAGGGAGGGADEEPRRIEGPPGSIEDAQDRILSRLSVGEQDSTRRMSWDRLYTHVIDKLFPISKAVKESGEALPTSENPYQLARLTSGVAGKAEHMLEHGTFDFNTYENNGPGLRDIIAPIKNDLDGFRAFATSVRAAELEKRGVDTGVDMADARQVAMEGNAKYGAVLNSLVDYQNKMAAYLRDSGVLSRAGYEAMLEANRFYVPFNRVMGENVGGARGVGASLQARNPVHRIEGSERIIVDPLENVIRNTYLFTTMAEKNAVGTKLIDMLLREGKPPEPVRVPITPHEPPGEPIEGRFREVDEDQIGGPNNRLEPPGAHTKVVSIAPERLPNTPGLEEENVKDFLDSEGVKAPDDLVQAMAAEARGDGKGEITIFRDGQKETYKVGPDLASAFKGLDSPSVGLIEKLLSIPSNILRAGAVLTPDFALRHTFRDFIYAAITNKEGVYTPVDMAKGFVGLITHDEDYQNWLKGGGANISMVSMDRRYLQESLEKLTGQTGLMTRAWNVIGNPEASVWGKAKAVAGVPGRALDKFALSPLRMLTELAEGASHLGAFKKAMRSSEAAEARPSFPLLEGPESPELLANPSANVPAKIGDTKPSENTAAPIASEATTSSNKADIQSAAWASRDTAVDAARSGASMRAYNMITAFANITLQDSDRIARAIKDDPVGMSVKIALGISLPSAILWAVNHNDPRYQEIPDWERDMFWIVMTPNHIWRVPKPFGAGVLFGSGVERSMQAIYDKNPDAFNHFFKSLSDTMVPQLYPTIAAPIIDQFANRSTFTNRTMIPSNLEKQLPEYQYTPYTSETAKALGRIVGAFPGMTSSAVDQGAVFGGLARALSSPILIENYVRGWSGNLGNYALSIADLGLRKAGVLPDPPLPTSTLSDIPIIKAFAVRYPSATAQSIQDFQDAFTANKVYYTTWQAQGREGNVDAMRRIQAAGGARIFIQLDSINKTLQEHNQIVRDVYKNPQIAPDEKRQVIDTLYNNMIQIARQGNAAMRQIDNATQGFH